MKTIILFIIFTFLHLQKCRYVLLLFLVILQNKTKSRLFLNIQRRSLKNSNICFFWPADFILVKLLFNLPFQVDGFSYWSPFLAPTRACPVLSATKMGSHPLLLHDWALSATKRVNQHCHKSIHYANCSPKFRIYLMPTRR